MIPPLSLKRNFSWNLLANVVYGGYQWMLVALLANWAGAIVVGQYSLALAVVTPLQMFLNLQLRAIQASDASGHHRFSHYLHLRLMTTTLLLLVATLVSIVWPYGDEVRLAIIGVVLVKAIESLADIFYGAFQQAERMDMSGQSRILESVLAFLAFMVIFRLTDSLFLALLGMAGALGLVLVFNTIRRTRSLGFSPAGPDILKPDTLRLRQLLTMSLPLGIAMGLLTLNVGLPRLSLGSFWTEFEVGIYAGFYQLVIAGTIVVGALGQAVTPVLARAFLNEDVTGFYHILNRLIGLALAMGAFAAIAARVLGEHVVKLIYSEEYGGYKNALIILAISSGFTFASSFQGYALTSARVLVSQTWMIVIVLLMTAMLLMVFVPPYGVNGASIAVLGGSVTQYVIGGWLLRTKYPREASR